MILTYWKIRESCKKNADFELKCAVCRPLQEREREWVPVDVSGIEITYDRIVD